MDDGQKGPTAATAGVGQFWLGKMAQAGLKNGNRIEI